MQQIYKKYENLIIDPETQKMLNKPIESATGLRGEHEDFLNALISKIGKGELDTRNVQTLYNHAVYDKLDENDREKADLTAINLMSMIRQIERLRENDRRATFQIQNLVDTVFRMKSGFEEKHGDVYII
jgi:hypothetical protein